MAAITKFDIASDALLLIGASTIASFDGASDESIFAGQLYQRTVNNLISLHPWRFATVEMQLSRATAEPLKGWDAAYDQPADMLSLEAVRIGDENIEFTRYQGRIHCDASTADEVYADFTYAAPEQDWPAYFVELAVWALAKKLTIPLSAKIDLKRDISGDLETQMRLARNADSRQQTARRLRMRGASSLIAARRT